MKFSQFGALPVALAYGLSMCIAAENREYYPAPEEQDLRG